jgi:glucosyl-dolichyl phosphate glucuronosyltransferase
VIQTANSISVIICAYTADRWNDLVAAVKSVQRQTLLPGEIVVVVDHNPGLLKRVREQVPGVVAVENVETPGLSGARNSGIAIAKGQIIAFLDDDAVATPDWLMFLSAAFVDPGVLGVGGAVTPLWSDGIPGWFPDEFYWVVGCTYRGMPQTAGSIRNPIGANMSFRREIFDIAGGFRNEIGRVGKRPVGCEETEFCIRVRQCRPQSTFFYQPQARVLHNVPNYRSRWSYFCARCYAEGLSKAIVTRCVGEKEGLASERNYSLRTLPQGVMRNLADALFRHALTGFARAGTIVVGLAVTTAGYLVGNIFLKVVKLKTSLSGTFFPATLGYPDVSMLNSEDKEIQ